LSAHDEVNEHCGFEAAYALIHKLFVPVDEPHSSLIVCPSGSLATLLTVIAVPDFA
jgi:hypothetical protein